VERQTVIGIMNGCYLEELHLEFVHNLFTDKSKAVCSTCREVSRGGKKLKDIYNK